jgi:hypothetical protein
VYFDSPQAAGAPARRCDRLLYLERRASFYATDNVAGSGATSPETGWAPLEGIRAGDWEWLEPRPVRIFDARFIQVNSCEVPCYYLAKPGEFIQA